MGYLIVHMFEHTFASHLHFGEETHHDELVNPVVGISALVGMLVHTFFDGVAIGAGCLVSPGVGLLLFLAVFLHKIPDGFTISSIVVSSGYSNRKALGADSAVVTRAHGYELRLEPGSLDSTLYVHNQTNERPATDVGI